MKDRIIALINENSGMEVTEATRLDSLGMDSLEMVEMLVQIGRDIVDIPDSYWEKLDTVGDIIACAELLVAA